MKKHRTQVMIDEDLYQGLKKLPREVSVSRVINLLLKAAIEDLKQGHTMNQKELDEWVRKDPERIKVRAYLQEKLGPYADMVDEAMEAVTAKGSKKQQKA